MSAFPKYDENSTDKPTGFTSDPEKVAKMSFSIEIVDSLICLLNRPGFKSIACQGNVFFEMTNECLGIKKAAYDRALTRINAQDVEHGLNENTSELVDHASTLSIMKVKLS
jgi:hypothetical protein